jgi:hypothetical protein
MKEILIKIFCLSFIFFLVVDFYILLNHFGELIFGTHHIGFIKLIAAIISLSLLIYSLFSCHKCKTFDKKDHKINKIR